MLTKPRGFGAVDPVEAALTKAGFDLKKPFRSNEDIANNCFVYTQEVV